MFAEQTKTQSVALKSELIYNGNKFPLDEPNETQSQLYTLFELCLRTMRLALNRSERFCEGSIKLINNDLNKLIRQHFDKKTIEQTGLKHAYRAMANDIYMLDPYIVGALTLSDEDTHVTTYTTQSGAIISLTRTSILNELLSYLDKEKIIAMCRKTSQYTMYYRHCINHLKLK
jgi:hypothetical protein